MAGRGVVENVDVTVNATDKASKTVDGVAKKLDGLDDVDVEVAATDDATKTIRGVDGERKKLDGADATVELKQSGADKLKADIHEILTAVDRVERADATVTVDVDTHNAKKQLDDVHDAAKDVGDGVSVDPLRDMSGALGDIGGGGLDAADGIAAAGEMLGKMMPQFAGFAAQLGLAGLAVGVGSILIAGLQELPGLLGGVSAQDAIAKKATEDLTKAFLDQGISVQGLNDELTEFLKGNPKLVAAMADLGISAKDFRDEMVGGTNPAVERARQLWDIATEAIGRFNTSGELTPDVLKRVSDQTGISEESLRTLLPQVRDVTDAIDGQRQGYDNAKKAAGEYQHVLGDLDGTTVNVEIETKEKGLAEIQEAYDNLKNKTVFVDFEGRTHVAGAMAGTPYWQGGPVRVGEAGPETVWLPRGSRVDTAGQTMARDRAAGATTIVYNVNVTVPVGAPTPDVGRYVADALDAHERRTGARRRARA